jgi:DNA polymerase-3 subunit epsilon
LTGYTVIDVETTGLSPETHDRIGEIGVVYVSDRGDIQDRWSTLINPQRDVGPTRIHGISATDATAAPTFQQLAPTFCAPSRAARSWPTTPPSTCVSSPTTFATR